MKSRLPGLASVAALLVLYGAAAARYRAQGFASVQVGLNLLGDNAVLGIVAVGMTFVILSGGIDLSVGAVMALSSVVVGTLITVLHWPAPAAYAAGIAAGLAIGVGMGAVIQFAGIKPFIVTLAGMFLARGVAFLVHLESISIDAALHSRLAAAGIPVAGGELSLAGLTFVLFVIAGVYVARYRPFGRAVYALGGSEESAVLMGLPVARTRVAVYGVSGMCSGVAGVVMSLYLSSGNPAEGVGLELDAIAAVVIGGTLLTGGVGSVLGTLVGVLIIGIIRTCITTYESGFSSGLTKVVIAGLLLVFVVMQRVMVAALRQNVATDGRRQT